MNAMILAAGLGTRLRPLTNHLPKALVPLGGKPMIEILIEKLARSGFDTIAINLHHFADQIIDFLKLKSWSNTRILISREKDILDTGGGIKQMLEVLQTQEPVLAHNVDVLSNLDFLKLMTWHIEQKADVTLAVQDRPTKRKLLFTNRMRLIRRLGEFEAMEPAIDTISLAFNGIQVINPMVFSNTPLVAFSSVDHYLQLAEQGNEVRGYRMDDSFWLDLGTPANLETAQQWLVTGKWSI